MKKVYLTVIILVIILSIFLICFKLFRSRIFGINISWEVNIPMEDELIYYKDCFDEDDIRMFGDGWYYTVLKYNNEKKINKLSNINWVSSKNEELEAKALDIIDKIDVSNEFIIDFTEEYQYFYKEKNKTNYIIIFFHTKNNMLYIVEQKT